MMPHIPLERIHEHIVIGGYARTTDSNYLDAKGIKAMLQLADKVNQPGIESLYLDVEDGQPIPENLLKQGIDFVIEQLSLDKKVMIACGAGQSRSAAFAIAALKEIYGIPLIEAYKKLKEHYQLIAPNPLIWIGLGEKYGERVSHHDLL